MAASTTGVVLITHAQWFVEIAGIPLLHRILLSGDKAGLQTWCLLAWQGAQQVRASLSTIPKLQGIAWHVYDLQDADLARRDVILPAEEVIVNLLLVESAF